MSTPNERLDVAAKIMAGLCANPAIIASNDRCGWSLVNSNELDLSNYSVFLADTLITCERKSRAPVVDRIPRPTPNPPASGGAK